MANLSSFGGDTSQKFKATGFFRIEKTSDRWWLVDPEGNAFITVGLNHADESNLKYEHNYDIWKEKYGSREKWIKKFQEEIKDWGFNTIGWTSDYISGDWGTALDWYGDPIDLGHSTPWCTKDYENVDMPYCLLIPVAEIQDWNGNPAFPDVFSDEFDMYCEYLARSICSNHADDKNLIGYYFVDIPAWIPHASGRFFKQLEGLTGQEYDNKLYEVATKYYDTITKHIRKYDPNHLILGDRYNGNKEIPTPVISAMKPYVDVLSVQYFPSNNEEGYQQMRDDLDKWQKIADKPVIIADIGNNCATDMNPHRVTELKGQGDRAKDYIDSLDKVINEPWFIGWHWCAHVENKARGWGIKDPYDELYEEFVNPVSKYNKEVYKKIK